MASLGDVITRNRLRVSETRFVQLVEQSLQELGGPAATDPSGSLTGDEVAALRAVDADVSPLGEREPDPRAPGAAAYAALLADALTVAEAAAWLGIDTSRVRHRLAKHQLLGIRRPRGWLLPAYQFASGGGLLPGVDRVAAALVEAHPVTVARFFATVAPDLVVDRRRLTPRQWLEGGGDPSRVAAAARTLDLVA